MDIGETGLGIIMAVLLGGGFDEMASANRSTQAFALADATSATESQGGASEAQSIALPNVASLGARLTTRSGRPRRLVERAVNCPTGLCAGLSLVAGDALAFLAAWGALLPFGLSRAMTPAASLAVGAAAIALFGLAGLYPGHRLHDHERLRRRVHATLELATAGGVAALFLSADGLKAGFLAAFLGLGLLFQLICQELVRAALYRAGHWGETVALVGSADEVAHLRSVLKRNWRYGLRPAADEPSRVAVVAHLPAAPELARLREEFAQVVLFGSGPRMARLGTPFEAPVAKAGEIGLTLTGRSGPSSASLERAFDLAVAVPAAILVAPVLVLACLAILVIDPGPVFYRQMREGFDGAPFPLLKLRTMCLDAEARLERLLQADPSARAEWEAHFKLRQDPRILPVVGRFLRASSLDEVPQLFNVIAGSMRIVGPRPFPDYHLAAMDAEFRARRRRMRPGLTGLWQISERSAADVALQQEIDEFYMENRCFWFDLHIILNTVSAVLRGRGAY